MEIGTRGRPRSEAVQTAILKATLTELKLVGFRALTMDAIALRSGVGKMTIYRRWPNKAAVVMNALLAIVGPETKFPEHQRAIERVRLQLHAQVKFFNGRYGKLVKALLGEAQFDGELALAFRELWIIPRRQMTAKVIDAAIQEGALRKKVEVESVIDMLYSPLYYRLLIGTGRLDESYADEIFDHVVKCFGV